MQILDTIRLFSIAIGYHHVKSHQDTATSLTDRAKKPLSRQAQLNVECDHLATATLQTARPAPIVTFLPVSKAAVNIEGQSVTRKIPRSIHTLIGVRRKMASFHRHYGWMPGWFDQIDWNQFRSANANMSLKKRVFVVKWLNDLLRFRLECSSSDNPPWPANPKSVDVTRRIIPTFYTALCLTALISFSRLAPTWRLSTRLTRSIRIFAKSS
jgi:hypothetical protein